MYGVEGGNGVILITTKSGKRNQETQFSFDSSYGQQSVEKTIAVLNATEYAAILNEGSVASGGPVIFDNLLGLGSGTDWQKEVLRTDAPIIQNNFSARGGSEKVSYYLATGIPLKKVFYMVRIKVSLIDLISLLMLMLI